METDVEAYLRRRYEGRIANIEILEKEDLDLVSLHVDVPASFAYFIYDDYYSFLSGAKE